MEFQTVRDVLSFAISLEHISQEFYQELADEVTDSGVRSFLLEMVQQEALHEQQLRDLLEDGGAHLLGTVDDSEIHSYIQAMQVPDELDYKKAVKVAFDKENASQMLYTILSNMIQSDEAIRKLLLDLAKQEKIHKEFFAKEYDRIRLSEN
ncbi:MAG: ferritin family protein [Planctomycetes bacterium]|nr:ferritin family protein [Planctomycetota bacterium]